MKYIYLGFLICFFIPNSFCQPNKDLKSLKLKGKVKSLTTYYYSVTEKFGEVQKENLKYKSIYKFNKNGNYECIGCGESDETTYFYDFKSRLIKSESLYSKSLMGPHFKIFKYDERGNNIEENTLKSNGEIIYKYIRKYNQGNDKIEENEYGSNGDLRYKRIYKYDSKGNEIQQDMYSSNGDLYCKANMKYDGRGNCIGQEERMPIDLSKQSVTKYDLKNNEISYENIYTGVSMKKYNSQSTFEYKFDVKGNIISEIQFENGTATELQISEIEYYPLSK